MDPALRSKWLEAGKRLVVIPLLGVVVLLMAFPIQTLSVAGLIAWSAFTIGLACKA